jgi:hypothetical protein
MATATELQHVDSWQAAADVSDRQTFTASWFSWLPWAEEVKIDEIFEHPYHDCTYPEFYSPEALLH